MIKTDPPLQELRDNLQGNCLPFLPVLNKKQQKQIRIPPISFHQDSAYILLLVHLYTFIRIPSIYTFIMIPPISFYQDSIYILLLGFRLYPFIRIPPISFYQDFIYILLLGFRLYPFIIVPSISFYWDSIYILLLGFHLYPFIGIPSISFYWDFIYILLLGFHLYPFIGIPSISFYWDFIYILLLGFHLYPFIGIPSISFYWDSISCHNLRNSPRVPQIKTTPEKTVGIFNGNKARLRMDRFILAYVVNKSYIIRGSSNYGWLFSVLIVNCDKLWKKVRHIR